MDPASSGPPSFRTKQTFLVLTGSTAGCVSSPASHPVDVPSPGGTRRGTTWKGSMRRPGIGLSVALGLLWHGVGAHSATLAPSADPVAAFVSAADSVYRAGGDAALSQLVKDNPDLVGASVAKLLEGDAALARRVAALSGSVTAKELVEVSARWTKTQRAQRANAVALESQSVDARKAGD